MAARERRQREEEERLAQQRAGAAARLKRLEDERAERLKREQEEKAAAAEQRKQEEADKWRHREVLKNEEHPPEANKWRDNNDAGERQSFAPVGIMQRDSSQSRRTLWVPNADKSARPGDDQRSGKPNNERSSDRERQ